MTTQLDDHVFHNKILYTLADVVGKGVFLPQRYVIEPEIIATDCHRGFHATYEVRDSQLHLTEVYINLRRKDSRKGERGELACCPMKFHSTIKSIDGIHRYSRSQALIKDEHSLHHHSGTCDNCRNIHMDLSGVRKAEVGPM